MDGFTPFGWPALAAALLVTPHGMARHLAPRATQVPALALAGAAAVLLNTAVPSLLHAAGCALTPATLSAVHVPLALVVLLLLRLRRVPLRAAPDPDTRRYLLVLAGFAVLALPYTHMVGIDTYKWQDLASAVANEHAIPWLVHPLALLGFAPRAYPSAQPLLLATIQLLGATGVDAGFGLLSLFTGGLALAAMTTLARSLWPAATDNRALGAGLLYVAAPVFLRYGCWATGRGLLLAVLPLLLWAIVRLPAPAAAGGLAAAALLAALSHKAGLVAVGLIGAAALATPLCARVRTRPALWLLLLPCAAGALLLAPSPLLPWPCGTPLGAARQALARFGVLAPLALAGLAGTAAWTAPGPLRRLLLPLLVTLPLACAAEMYGALLALPLVVVAAVTAQPLLDAAGGRRTPWLRGIVLGLVALAAVGTVVRQTVREHTPQRLWQAAQFINATDPLGPCRIEATYPLARRQIQGYVTGCPRFTVATGARPARATVTTAPPPAWRGPPTAWLRAWIHYLRGGFDIEGAAVSWYGDVRRVYHVVVDGSTPPPAGAERVYAREGVEIYREQLAGEP